MQRLEILNVMQVATDYSFDTKLFWFVVILVSVFFIIFGSFEGDIFISTVCGFFVGCLIGAIVCAGWGEPISYENQYKVMITDEVSMSEFLEQYEVIEQEGKILTIREKDDENN